MNIGAGKDERLDIAIKYPEEDDCYAMNDKNWELNQANLKLTYPQGTFQTLRQRLASFYRTR
jgi:hypothetical protein